MPPPPAVESVELRPDRDLLDPHFESYKLSLDSPPAFRTPLSSASVPSPLSSRQPGDDHYSYLHAKLFSLSSNLLSLDSHRPELVFLLHPENGGLWRVAVEKEGATKAPELIPVWSSPEAFSPDVPGRYNPSLSFAGPSLAVHSDGAGTLTILETGDRSTSADWKSVFSGEICGTRRPFVVTSAVALPGAEGEGDRSLHCLLSYVEEKEKVEGLKATSATKNINFVNVVEWISFSYSSDNSSWELDRVRRFAFYGSADYLQLEKDGAVAYAATEKPFVKVFDSAGGDEAEEEEPVEENKSPERPPPFFWHQGVEDMVVWVPLPGGQGERPNKREIKVSLKPREMSISIRGEKVMGGALWNVLDSDSMTWTIQGSKLEVNVCKANEGLIWQKFVDSADEDGLEISRPEDIDDAIAHTAKEVGKRPAATKQSEGEDGDAPPPSTFNAQELEECDALPDDCFALFAISCSDKDGCRVTRRANLSSHQHLFTQAAVVEGRPSALCLRHDVDGLVWQPQDSSFVHVGTYPALGYVQASKEQRRFTAASPSMSYAAIAEGARRVYLYRQPAPIASEFDLRNRKSGRRVSQVAKQQVVTLEGGEAGQQQQVQGIAATDGTLVVLTTDSVHCLRMT